MHVLPKAELSTCITSDKWDSAIQICKAKPQMAKVWTRRQGFFEGLKDSNVLPLHESLVANAPIEVVKTLLDAYPEGIKERETSYLRFPLHCACRKNADPEIVQVLLNAYKDASLEADSLGRLPLHYALSNGANDEVIQLLLQFHPNAARGVDNRGWTPLHVACGMGASTSVVELLLKCYPEASIMKTKKGSRPLKCLHPDAANKTDVKKILLQQKKKIDESFRPAALVRTGSERTLV